MGIALLLKHHSDNEVVSSFVLSIFTLREKIIIIIIVITIITIIIIIIID